jgi:hypothetical protein
VLDTLREYWALILGGWLVAVLSICVFVARAGRVLNRSPRFWRCDRCQTVFARPVALAIHIEDHCPDLMPRVDA